MDFARKSKVGLAVIGPSEHKPQRRQSLIENYYAWRHNEFEAALRDAAIKEALHKTPPPSPVYKRKVAQIDGKTYVEKTQRKKFLEDVGEHSLDIFKPHKKKKFAMYPVVPHSPDETPCMSPNLSENSLDSSYHHNNSFPHLPEIEESEHEEDDTTNKPMVFTFSSKSSLHKISNDSGKGTKTENHMERKLLPTEPNEPKQKKRISKTPSLKKDVDVERNIANDLKFTKWEIAQEFVPWVMIVTSVIQIALFMADRDEFFQLLVFAPKHMFELWRFVTYIFLHTNFTHLLLNVLIQILLAIPLEFEQNHGRTAVVYFGGSVLGGCGVMLFGPQVLVVGASAGVYSLLMSHVPHTILNKRMIRYRNVRLGIVLFLCLCDLIHTVVHIATNSEPKIGVWAHVFGALGGLLLGLIFYKFIDPEDNLPIHYMKLKKASLSIVGVIIISSVVYGIVH